MSDGLTPSATLIWKLIADLLGGYVSRKERFFEHHIQPLQERMELIHKDYVQGFSEMRRHLALETKPPAGLIVFLRERRRERECERTLSNSLARGIRKMTKRGLNNDARKEVEAYCRSVVRYFRASSDFGDASWYSHFIEIVEHYVAEGRDMVWEPVFIHGSPRLDVLHELDHILEKKLPGAFGRLADCYATLRAVLL